MGLGAGGLNDFEVSASVVGGRSRLIPSRRESQLWRRELDE